MLQKDQPIDIECHGGLHIYAVPVRVGGEVIGSINFGYGDPPRDPQKLKEIADKYNVSVDELLKYADTYESRPSFIIEIAKHRLLSSARLISEIIGHKQTEEALRKAHDELEQRVKERTTELAKANDNLKQEINERKRVEKALRESEQWFRDLTESTSDWIWEIGREGVYTYSSPKVKELLGYESEEIIGKTPFDLMPSEEAKRVSDIFSASVSSQKPFDSLENTNLHKNGYPVIMETSGIPIFDAEGEFLGYRGIDRDITERKRIDEELKRSEANLVQAQQMTRLGSWELDLVSNDLRWSAEAYRIFEVDSETFTASFEAFLDVIHPDDREFVNKAYTDSIRSKTPYNIEHRLLMKDGRIKYVNERCETIYDLGGNPQKSTGTILDITERKLAEQELREANNIINRSPVVAFLWKNVEGWPVEFVSDNVVTVFGYTEEEFTSGQITYAKTIHPDDLERVTEEVSTFSKDKGKASFVHEPYRILAKDGKVKWLDDRTFIRRDNEGRITHYEGVCADITDRIQAEEAIRKLSRAIEASPASVVITDRDGTIEYVNPKFVDVTGYTAEEALGENPRILSSGRHSPEFYREMWNTLTAGDEWHGEFCNRKKNGEMYFESASIASVKNAQDQVTHYVAVKEDITERISSENELRENEAKFRSITSTAINAIIMIDHQGLITLWNRSAEIIFGWSSEEVIGKNLQETILPQRYIDAHTKGFHRFQKTGKRLSYDKPLELSALRRDGVEIPIELSLSAVQLKGKRNVVGILNDISARKQAEKNLLIAKEAAEAAAQAKSNFLANMSHEIRTPMNAILGFLELVLEDPSIPERQRKHLTTAQISASGLLGLLNDILDISKLESGKLTIEQHPFSLLRLMQEIHETMDIKAREKGLKLQLDIQPSISGSFVGDPLRLRQILINLAANAIKFTKKGSVFMRIMPAEEEGQLHFVIQDTGIGIPADRLSQIFESFTQADTSTTRQFGGTGLGTTISRELVELMGGRIWAESEEGRGSTFHFTINLTPADQVPEKADLFVVPGRAVLLGARRGFKILLVEDVEANVDLAKIRLEQQGHEVTVVWNGREAVEAFQRGEIDLILMDIQMPVMDGIEATTHIRALEAGTKGHIPIIAMTAGVMREETEKYMEVGMDAVVAKPIDFGKLFKTMEEVVPEGVGEMVVEVQEDVRPPSGLEFPPLNGVDTKNGIQTWRNPEAYTKALIGFSHNYGNVVDKLSSFIDEGDIDSAYRIAHKLKGVAGNLSIKEVADAAISIDAELRKKRIDDVKDQLPTLAAALNRVIDSIMQLEAMQDVEEMPKKEMDIAHLTALFIKMFAAFDLFSPSVVEPFLSELKEYLSQDQLSPIVNHMERFDFDGAKQETVKLAKTLKIDLEK